MSRRRTSALRNFINHDYSGTAYNRTSLRFFLEIDITKAYKKIFNSQNVNMKYLEVICSGEFELISGVLDT